MARYGMKLRESVRANGIAKTVSAWREGVKAKRFKVSEFSLREAAQSMIGENWADHLHRFCMGDPSTRAKMQLREASDAVDASGFTAITGQILIDQIKEKYKLATFVGDKLFRVEQVTNGNLGTYRKPWLSDTVSEPAQVQQMQEYPATSFSANYVDLPAPQKYGRICRVSWEMIYADLTKQAIDSAQSVGKRVGLWVEKQRLRVVAGLINNYSWNGTTYNSFLTSGSWVNKLTDSNISKSGGDWTDVNRIELLFAQMLDPTIGEPIDIETAQVLTVPACKYQLKRILHATEVRTGNITSGTGTQTIAENPLDDYEIIVSKHLRKLLTDAAISAAEQTGYPGGGGLSAAVADTYKIWGDFKKAFVWREVFPMQTIQAPPQAGAEFNQDIPVQIKANVFGAAGIEDPRYVVLDYNSSAS